MIALQGEGPSLQCLFARRTVRFVTGCFINARLLLSSFTKIISLNLVMPPLLPFYRGGVRGPGVWTRAHVWSVPEPTLLTSLRARSPARCTE